MNEPSGVDLKALVAWLAAGLMGLINVVLWFSRRDMGRYDRGLERIETLERTAVTYDHLERVLDKMRNEREAMHRENQAYLVRIEDKIDANEQRASATRHKTYDDIHQLAMQFAVENRRKRNPAE